MKPCATEVRGKFLRKSHEASPSAPRMEGRESQKLESVHKEAAFLFSYLHCKLNMQNKNTKYFMPWQKLDFPHGEEKREGFLRKLLKWRGCFWV